MTPRLVLFDCDGTLVDSQHRIVAAMREAFARLELAAPPPEAVRGVVGLSLERAIASLNPKAEPETLGALVRGYREAYLASLEADGADDPLYPGAREAIARLEAAGFLLGIATGKSRRGLVRVLEQHRLAAHFVTLQTADDAPSKPDPTMVLNAAREAGAAPETTVVVGDTAFDMAMARNAGARALGVAWGYHPAEALLAAGAERVLDDFEGLAEAIAAEPHASLL